MNYLKINEEGRSINEFLNVSSERNEELQVEVQKIVEDFVKGGGGPVPVVLKEITKLAQNGGESFVLGMMIIGVFNMLNELESNNTESTESAE